MKYIDIFKYYSFDKLDRKNKYFEIKKDNYERVRNAYFQDFSVLDCYPIRATIQTTEKCNLNCKMCQIHGKTTNRKLLSMSKENLDFSIKKLFPYLIEFHPTNIGEPLIYEWFDYLCKKTFEYGVLFDITTNGMLLTEDKIKNILPTLLDIKISFDGIKKETFENIRINSVFDIVLRNIDNLLKIKSSITNKATVTLQMTLLKSNYLELPDIIYFAHKKGIDRVKAFHVFSYFDEINNLSLIPVLDKFEEIRLQSIKLAEELNVLLEISEPQTTNNKDMELISQKCRLLWTECWIDVDGKVLPCHSHQNKEYGHISNVDFMQNWNSEFYQTLRDFQNKKNPIDICENCGMNYLKYDENQTVSLDINNFMNKPTKDKILWSNRSKQFLINRKNG
jgi:radical SAM protein with 4Fe4S-binding SPASM domain